jgi:hypothetical protein
LSWTSIVSSFRRPENLQQALELGRVPHLGDEGIELGGVGDPLEQLLVARLGRLLVQLRAAPSQARAHRPGEGMATRGQHAGGDHLAGAERFALGDRLHPLDGDIGERTAEHSTRRPLQHVFPADGDLP